MGQIKAPLIGLSTHTRPVELFGRPTPFSGLTFPYIEALRAAGGIPMLLPHGAGESELRELVGRLDGLLLPGGVDLDPASYGEERHPACGRIDPAQDALELPLTRLALESDTPLLAICRGLQVLNVALGGTLWQDLASQRPESLDHAQFGPENRLTLVHPVEIEADSMVVRIMGATSIQTNSSHHQAVRELAPGLRAVAHAPDGVIEAVELSDHPFAVGLQWHPEAMFRHYPEMLRPFRALVEAAGG